MKHLLFFMLSLASATWSSEHLNILVYHHVSTNTPPSTTISPENFRAHLQLLKDEGFTVVSLEEGLKAMTENTLLPKKAVAITFDDGYRNIYENAYPLLKEFDYPFTLFIATDAIDQKYKQMLSWDQIREMQDNGVTIANHSTDHAYMVRFRRHDEAWREITQSNIERAQERLNAELNQPVPKWFAYPYGEFSKAMVDLLKDMKYIGFAQHSGGLWSGTNLQAIPRFAAAGIYANPKSLLTKLNSRPMPVEEAKLADMITTESQPLLQADLTVTEDQSPVLNCFVDGNWTDANRPSPTQFKLQANEPLSDGRHRYNCTAKSKASNFYYWFSKPWLIYPEFETQ